MEDQEVTAHLVEDITVVVQIWSVLVAPQAFLAKRLPRLRRLRPLLPLRVVLQHGLVLRQIATHGVWQMVEPV